MLHARVGDEVVVVSQAADGSLANELYWMTGIVESGDEGQDRTAFYLHLADAQELLVMEGRVHAIGTRPLGIWRMVVAEAGGLAVLSIGLGMVLGLAVTYIFSRVGIDYRGIEMGGMTVQDLIYPVLYVRQFLVYPLWVFLFTVIVGTYPATSAARLKPAQSLRKSL